MNRAETILSWKIFKKNPFRMACCLILMVATAVVLSLKCEPGPRGLGIPILLIMMYLIVFNFILAEVFRRLFTIRLNWFFPWIPGLAILGFWFVQVLFFSFMTTELLKREEVMGAVFNSVISMILEVLNHTSQFISEMCAYVFPILGAILISHFALRNYSRSPKSPKPYGA
jgi:hypothetical protein